MCQTAWCGGDCEDCLQDKKREQKYENNSATCPYKSKCILETLDVKTDRCVACGTIFNY